VGEEIQENPPPSILGPDEVSVCSCNPADWGAPLQYICRPWGELLPIGCLKCDQASRNQRLPSGLLFSPVGEDRNQQELPELNRIPAPKSAWQEKNSLLNVRGEAKQAYDLT
jgi:hypothetical protein